nr:NERD domain-containing protein [Petropleomorpha daqingensis]
MYPEEPEFEAAAERAVVEALRHQLPDDAVLFVNQRFTDWRGDREADVILAWPGVGVAVVEVKGGSVSLRDGRWWQTGAKSKSIDPVKQARLCKYMLRNYLAQHPRWSRGPLRSEHFVALPTTVLPEGFTAPDAPRWLVLDKTDMHESAGRIAAVLRAVDDQPDPPTQEDVDLLVDCLAGQLIPQRDLVSGLAERELTCEALTKDQAKVLDLLRNQHRVEIRGGAGSGKTWLAIEKARRLAAEGKRVALMCYSRGLAEFLSRRVQQLPPAQRPAYVGTFHNLGIGWGVLPGSDDDSDYWENFLPTEMVSLAAALPLSERFDAVVIDEAQDFAESWWPAVLAALRNPDEDSLYVFADEGQRVFARQGRPTVDLVAIDLDENLRNTKQIAGTFSSLAPSQMRMRGGNGVPVRFVQCSTQDAVGVADDEAVALLDEGWPPDAVALLTTGSRHPEQSSRQQAGQEAYWASFWDDDDLFYGHVLGFKGLERPAVVLAVNGFRDEERAKEMLYVGLSRARDLLVVCGDLEVIRRVGGEAVVRRLVGSAAA